MLVERLVERKRVLDRSLVDFSRTKSPPLEVLQQPKPGGRIARDRLRNRPNPALPGKAQKREFCSQPISGIVRVLKVGLEQEARLFRLDQEHAVVGPAGQRPQVKSAGATGAPRSEATLSFRSLKSI